MKKKVLSVFLAAAMVASLAEEAAATAVVGNPAATLQKVLLLTLSFLSMEIIRRIGGKSLRRHLRRLMMESISI